eukprot:COSAG02_NODE_1335_length_13197_cov_5.830279_6_plen_128_part_00
MASPRAKYYLNYDMRKMWCPEFMKGPSVPPVYPNLEPEMAIARDWHSYRPIKEAWLMFGLGIGGLFGLAAVSAYDVTGYRARRPWVRGRSSSAPTLLARPPRPHSQRAYGRAPPRTGDAVRHHAAGV